jgi:phenylacetate-CoA ligase
VGPAGPRTGFPKTTDHDALASTRVAARGAPFYAARLPAEVDLDVARFRQLPLTTKADLRASYPFGLLAVPRERVATYHESSGTTGQPTASFFTDADWDDVAERFMRSAIDVGPRDTVLVKTPYALATTAHQMHRAARRRGAMVVPADNRSHLMPYAKVVQLLRDVGVTVTWCLPTEPLLWAAAARKAGLCPKRDFPALRAFLVAGEPVGPRKRARLGAIWGGRAVFEDYGSTETGSLGGECAHGQMHLWSDRLLFEVIDETTGRASFTGDGLLVVTTLYREAMPLVRYLVEDRVRVSDAPCPCGSPHPTVRVLGRGGAPTLVQGRPVHAGELEELVYALPEDYGVELWRARVLASSLRIEIEAARGFEDVAADELAHEIFRTLGLQAEVEARPPAPLVQPEALTARVSLAKPRFLFKENEDWSTGLNYW